MGTKLILPTITLLTPILIFILYLAFQNNHLIKYFVPSLLGDKEYPKQALRQAGAGCLIFSLWLIGVIASVCLAIDFNILEKMVWPMALLCFVIPIISIMFLCIGIYYLIIGIFARSECVKLSFQSVFYAEKVNLELYVKKLRFYTILNLSFLFGGILSLAINIIFEKHVGERLIPLNVLFLIGFILTIWRMRAYITKTAQAMDLSGKRYFLTTVCNPLGLFFVWVHAFGLMKKFKERK